MPEVNGIDHIYIAVSDMAVSEAFYDRILVESLGFRKNKFELEGEAHIQYYCRHFGYVIRPARSGTKHDPYSPGLHHFCFRVDTQQEVQEAFANLSAAGIKATEPKLYPEYAEDYTATFFEDPDGIRLEITNYRKNRRERHDNWYQTEE